MKSCRNVSFLTGPHCQFLCVGQGMKLTLIAESVVSIFKVQLG